MVRYYFHMKSKHYELLDEKGKVLGGAWEAYVHAQAIIQKCQYDLWPRDDQDQWMIEICDDSGSAELIIRFPRQTH